MTTVTALQSLQALSPTSKLLPSVPSSLTLENHGRPEMLPDRAHSPPVSAFRRFHEWDLAWRRGLPHPSRPLRPLSLLAAARRAARAGYRASCNVLPARRCLPQPHLTSADVHPSAPLPSPFLQHLCGAGEPRGGSIAAGGGTGAVASFALSIERKGRSTTLDVPFTFAAPLRHARLNEWLGKERWAVRGGTPPAAASPGGATEAAIQAAELLFVRDVLGPLRLRPGAVPEKVGSCTGVFSTVVAHWQRAA